MLLRRACFHREPPPRVEMNKSRADHEPGPDSTCGREHDVPEVVIELSEGQVAGVVHAASESGNMSVLLSSLKNIRDAVASRPEQSQDSRLSGSLLLGLLILASFPADRSSLRNAELARKLGLSQSKIHRYLYTLVAAGLVERDPRTRGYRLVAL
jgi:hypothetical protein